MLLSITPKSDIIGKFSANGRIKVVRNQFSTEGHMSRIKIEISFAPRCHWT